MSDKQKLTAQCSSLQRENEQLVELVGYLSIEQQQLLEEQQQLQKDLYIVQNGTLLEDGSWSLGQHQQQNCPQHRRQQSLQRLHAEESADPVLVDGDELQLASSDSSMGLYITSDDDTVVINSR